MPSPRQILADITDLKLDPNVEHKHFKSGGRLVSKTTDIVSVEVVEIKADVKLDSDHNVQEKHEDKKEEKTSEPSVEKATVVVENSQKDVETVKKSPRKKKDQVNPTE